LHGDATTLGVLGSAAGIGALAGALTLASRTRVDGLGKWVWMACTSFGTFLILFSFSHHYFLSVLLLVPVGFSLMTQMGATNTLVQSMVPDRLRGRTMAVYSMMFMGMSPLGAILAGAAADKIGAPMTVALGGACAIAGAIAFARHLPKIRVEARQLLSEQGLAGEERAEGVAARAS